MDRLAETLGDTGEKVILHRQIPIAAQSAMTRFFIVTAATMSFAVALPGCQRDREYLAQPAINTAKFLAKLSV